VRVKPTFSRLSGDAIVVDVLKPVPGFDACGLSTKSAQSNLPTSPVSSKILEVQPNRLENLDDLLAQAEHYAHYSMRNIGRLPPTLFLIGSKGPLIYMPESLADESDKEHFATTARLMCIAYAAIACVMALEAWVKFAKQDEKFDETEPPSEAFDRQEVVVLMGESHTGHKQKFLPIVRSGNGKFFGWGESDAPPIDEIKGRFAQLLPIKVPDEGIRLVAKAMLKVEGVGRLPARRRGHAHQRHRPDQAQTSHPPAPPHDGPPH